MNEDQLISHYRAVYAAFTGRPRGLRPSSQVPADARAARAFLDWCAERGVPDIADFVRLRFEEVARAGRFAHEAFGRDATPRFGSLASESVLALVMRRGAQAAAAATQRDQRVQHIRDLSYLLSSHEAVRRNNAQRPELCLSDELSGGFDPRSRYCPSCSVAGACSLRQNAREGFDVAALRGGDLHRLPLEVRKVLRGWDGGV